MGRFGKSQCVRPAEGANGVRITQSHWSKRRSSLDFAKYWQCHAIFSILGGVYPKHCNSLLSSFVNGADKLILFTLRVSHKVPLARSWSGYSRLDLYIRGHRQMISTPREDRFLLRMCANRFQPSPKLSVQLIRCFSVCTITGRLLGAGTMNQQVYRRGYEPHGTLLGPNGGLYSWHG